MFQVIEKKIGLHRPNLEDVPALANALFHKAKDGRPVTTGFKGAGIVMVLPGDSQEKIELEILEALAS